MEATSATPVLTLREHASRLEAAVSVSLARPRPKNVHALRSETRRIEAQLDLLAMLHNLPAYHPAADKLLRRLKKLRSIAGKVRDCDVHRKLLRNGDAHLSSTPEAPKNIGQDEKRLRKFIGRERDRYEKKLLSTVRQQGPRLTGDLEALLDALKPGEDVEAPSAAMLAEIQQRFTRLANNNATGEEHLHELRKSAKRARYQCEGLPGPEAAAMATQFEDLQDAGGEWHDLLQLAVRAHDRFGPDHPMSRVLEHRRDQRLDRYSWLLGQFRDTHPAPRETHTRPRKTAAPRRTKAAKRSTAKKTAKSTARKSVKRARAQ